ncbi:hypothetical protein M0R04_01035 [Candidatus Dojkabacteria bacterium]|nr:hypothetical protein [Candidatus Dojkabacteria bacterium]
MKRSIGFVLTALIIPLVLASSAFAKIGVGVGTGKIQVNDKLKAGQIYELPSIPVVNTGDETSFYSLSITYHEKQTEKMPPKEWFSFDPAEVEIEPSKIVPIKVRLTIPVKAIPGDYFAYVEAAPIKKTSSGNTSISIAAAAKLYFTISPSNFVEGVYYRALSLWQIYQPWTTITSITIGVVVLFFILRKYLKIEINVRDTSKQVKKAKVDEKKSE